MLQAIFPIFPGGSGLSQEPPPKHSCESHRNAASLRATMAVAYLLSQLSASIPLGHFLHIIPCHPVTKENYNADVWLLIEFIRQVLSESTSGGRLSPLSPACPHVTGDSFTFPPGSSIGPVLPPTEVFREDWSLTCLKGHSVREGTHPLGRLALTQLLSSSSPLPSVPFPEYVPGFASSNQRRIEVLFPETKKQFLLKGEFRPHFEDCFLLFIVKVFTNVEVTACWWSSYTRIRRSLRSGSQADKD